MIAGRLDVVGVGVVEETLSKKLRHIGEETVEGSLVGVERSENGLFLGRIAFPGVTGTFGKVGETGEGKGERGREEVGETYTFLPGVSGNGNKTGSRSSSMTIYTILHFRTLDPVLLQMGQIKNDLPIPPGQQET